MSDEFSEPFVAVSGAGLSGALAAVYLAQMGFKVHMFERRPDMRKEDISAGKSINLALSARGIFSLEEVGVADEILPLCVPMYGRLIHKPGQPVELQHYSADGKQAILSVSRGDLNMKLLDRAEALGVRIHFERPVIKVDRRSGELVIQSLADKTQCTIKPVATVGADGAFSAVRTTAIVRADRTDYSQSFLKHGYKELCIPPTEKAKAAAAAGQLDSCPLAERFRTGHNGLHIWPRGHLMLIALPNMDGSFTVTLFLPFEPRPGGTEQADRGFDNLRTREEVEQFFGAVFADAPPLLPELYKDFEENPTGSLVTVRCYPWSLDLPSPVTLCGDACHAVVPFFGQGMNASLQDVTVLARCIRQHVLNMPDASHEQLRTGAVKMPTDGAARHDRAAWYRAFHEYEQFQKPNADAIADMALENFIEMRDSTADPDFVFRKEIEHKLTSMFPNQFLGRYEMVSFSTIPYAEAYRRGEENARILSKLMENNADRDLSKVDFNLAEKLVNEAFPLASSADAKQLKPAL